MTWPEEPENLDGKVKFLRTDKGRQFEADLVVRLCSLSTSLYLTSLAPMHRPTPSFKLHGRPLSYFHLP